MSTPFRLYGTDLFGEPVLPGDALAARFGAPPFSVLSARGEAWRARKEQWLRWGVTGATGRTQALLSAGATNGPERAQRHATNYQRGAQSLEGAAGIYMRPLSVFDPVLCELVYRWFCPPGGTVLDPFAGECTKGLVAAHLGHPYTGVELRPEQVEANREALARITPPPAMAPQWVVGDSGALDAALPEGEAYDLVWTSPPYFDLEVYSGEEEDGSGLADYAAFSTWYCNILVACAQRLKRNRFLVVKVGEVRDKRTGAYHNFVGDTVRILRERCGLAYYNEIIYVTPVGSLALRSALHLNSSRKVGKAHQNVLVFYDGDPRKVREHFTGVVPC